MTSLEHVLRSHGIPLDAPGFVDALDRLLTAQPIRDHHSLSTNDQNVLLEIGVPPADITDDPAPIDPVGFAHRMLQQWPGLSVAEAAEQMHRAEGRVRSMVSEKTLYGIRIGRRLYLPAWQFDDDGVPRRSLPHLREIVAAIPSGIPPGTLARVMTSPSDELVDQGTARSMTPRDWLIDGLAVTPVVSLLDNLFQW